MPITRNQFRAAAAVLAGLLFGPPALAQTPEQARDFLSVHLDIGVQDISRGHSRTELFSWIGEILQMSDERWQWREAQTSGSNVSGRINMSVERLVYTATPSALAYPAKIVTYANHPAILIECAVAECISAEGTGGSGYVVWGNDEPNMVEDGPISRTASRNAWPFKDAETARRVLPAVNLLLKDAGAQEVPF